MNLMFRKPVTGQSATEYVLPVALIGVIAIAGLSTLGNTIRDIFAGMIQNNGPGVQGAPTQIDVGGSDGEPTGGGPNQQVGPGGFIGKGGTTPSPGQPPLVITLSNGTKLTLEEYPEELKRVLETVGSNGRTMNYRDDVMAIANDMLAKGQLTNTQYNGLQGIANGDPFTLNTGNTGDDPISNGDPGVSPPTENGDPEEPPPQ